MAEQTTYTASTAHSTVPAKLIETGLTPIVGKYVFTPAVAATYTQSCVVHLAKVQNKTTLVDGYINILGAGLSTGVNVYFNTTLIGTALGTTQGTPGRIVSVPLEASASASDGNNEYWNISIRNEDPATTTETVAFAFYIAKDGLTNTGRG